ncbi:hypothetical protein [Nonomuraea sp. NPDC049400]|uniref:hypothetical protein n=1 Tax=Nonomuraea sp. NPDC049400 TaxID=3364352 RepID=UPI00378867A0
MDVIATLALAGLLLVSGVTHWVFPAYYRTLVPGWVPLPGPVVAVTGGFDVLAGLLTAVPATRTIGAAGAAVLISGYLISHVDALVHARRDDPSPLRRPAGAIARILVNLGYIAWAVAVAAASR